MKSQCAVCYISVLCSLASLTSGLPSPVGLFSVVQFPNDACSGVSGLTGTCLTASECTTRSGSSDGTCAAGFGVCCLVVAETCQTTTISHNNTYVRNPSYPAVLTSSTSAQTCSYKVEKMSEEEICQLRLDFQTVELGQTASSGVCTDTFQVTTSVDSSAT